MEIILNKIIDWIEWLKNTAGNHDKRLNAIEDHLESSSTSNYSNEKMDELMKRLEVLENEESVQEDKSIEMKEETQEGVDEDVISENETGLE